MSKLSSLGFLHTRRILGYFAKLTAGSAESSPFYIVFNTELHFNQSALCQRSLNLGIVYMEGHMSPVFIQRVVPFPSAMIFLVTRIFQAER